MGRQESRDSLSDLSLVCPHVRSNGKIFVYMKIAVLGLGFMGSTHLKALKKIPHADLAAVVSSDEKKLSGDLTEIQGNIGGPGEKMDFSGVKKYRKISEALSDP